MNKRERRRRKGGRKGGGAGEGEKEGREDSEKEKEISFQRGGDANKCRRSFTYLRAV